MTEELSKLEQEILKEVDKADLSKKEVRVLLKTLQSGDKSIKKYRHYFSPTHTLIGYISDTHIGHKQFDERLLMKAFKFFGKEKPEAIYHAGDLVEGMSGRDGHIYELSHVGATQQANYAAELFSQSPIQIYGITGNHDLWFKNKANHGLDIGETIDNMCDKFTHLGENEAKVNLTPSVDMLLFHPSDGSAYALSYKMQKLMESFSSGEKPNIILEGHYHKSLYMFNRSIHGFECGTLCGQTPFMRGKKLPAHKGFGLIDIYTNRKGVDRLSHTFIPAYD